MKTYNSDSLGKFCFPSAKENLKKIANAFNQTGRIETAYGSIVATQNLIWGSIIFAFIFSFFFSWILEKCAGVVVAVSLIGFYLGAGYMAYVSYTQFKHYQAIWKKDTEPNVMAKGKMKFFQVCLFGILSALSVISCMICCLWSKLVLATRIIGVRIHFETLFNFSRLLQNSFLTQRELSWCQS